MGAISAVAGACVGFVIGVLAIFTATGGGANDAYAAFRDGRAQVVTYTVPGEGQCKAVLIDGRRQAEKCEGEKP